MKRYKVTLKTIGPVFIGSGEMLRQSQYFFRTLKSGTKQAAIIDERELIAALLRANKLDDFSKKIIDSEKKFRLLDYTKSVGIDPKSLIKYSLEVFEQKNKDPKKDKPMNDLNLFVRNGSGDAYVPGSSIKGALRTCILKAYKEDIEQKDLSKNKKSIFNYISISDSDIISNKDFAVYQKVDINTLNNKEKISGLPTYRESIKPGSDVTFTLNIDEKYISIEKIKKGIEETYEAYYRKWSSKIDDTLEPPRKDEHIIYLGGGAGFVSKTLLYKENSEEIAKNQIKRVLAEKFRNMYGQGGKIKLKPSDPVPVTMKFARLSNEKERFDEMGKCEIFFEEIFSWY